MPRKKRFDSVGFLYDRYVKGNRRLEKIYEDELLNARIAHSLSEMRRERGWTQSELAKRAKTSASVISRLEDPRYRGHSLTLLNRIVEALDYSLDIRFSKNTSIAAQSNTTARKAGQTSKTVKNGVRTGQ